MGESDRSGPAGLAESADPLEQVAESARGWHRIQLAALGFIGFCGVFWGGDAVAGRPGIQWLVMGLVAVAFVLAVVAIFLVGRVAYPFHGSPQLSGASGGPTVEMETRRLVTGTRVTYLAVALVVAATLSAWWPASPGDGTVVLGDAAGQTWCGRLVEAPAGEARLATADGPVAVRLDRLVLLHPVSDC